MDTTTGGAGDGDGNRRHSPDRRAAVTLTAAVVVGTWPHSRRASTERAAAATVSAGTAR